MLSRHLIVALGALVAVSGAGMTASAAEAPVARVAFTPEFAEKLHEDYGDREADVLRRDLDEALARAFEDVAQTDAGVTLDVTIEDARPNRPTMEQLGARVGLSYAHSYGIGGAELSGVLRAADGSVIAEIEHRYFEDDIRDVIARGTWSDARRAMRQFADKVADAYAQHARG
jgi:hypothetical protein